MEAIFKHIKGFAEYANLKWLPLYLLKDVHATK